MFSASALKPSAYSTLLTALLSLVLLALCLGGCASHTDSQQPPPFDVQIKLGYVACTTVRDTAPNFDCADGQLSVTRCTQETENPNPAQCTGPVGDEVEELGKVWCCQ